MFVASCSYASNETDILNDTVDTVSINTQSVDLKSDNDCFEDTNSDIDNISIYYGEVIDIEGGFDEQYNCTVYIDNKLVNFIPDLRSDKTINMYNYYEDYLNSIYPDVGLHNMSIIFEFETPQKYDITLEMYKDDFKDSGYIYNVLCFYSNFNDDLQAKKRYSYNTNLNILKKDKTVHITKISPFASYTNPLVYDVIVDNPNNSTIVFISNKTNIVTLDTSFGDIGQEYSFDKLRHKIKPGSYNLTVVNAHDNTFDTAPFTLCNDILINTTYRIKDNDVILNVELWCEYTTPIQVIMSKFINETTYDYRNITKKILANANNHKFKFEICFNDVDNNNYGIYIHDYYSFIDCVYLTVNYTHVNETEISEDNMNETVNVSNKYNNNNLYCNGTNGTGANLNLKKNNTDSNSYKSYQSNINDLKEVNSAFGDFIESKDSISSENSNSYEIISKSALKSSNNIFSNLGIIILLFIAGIIGYLKFKHEY